MSRIETLQNIVFNNPTVKYFYAFPSFINARQKISLNKIRTHQNILKDTNRKQTETAYL